MSQGEAEQVLFSAPLLVLEDVKDSQGELRFHVLGKHAWRLLHVTFARRAQEMKMPSFPHEVCIVKKE